MQFIIFEIQKEHFGYDLTKIKEINRKMLITPVPNAPPYFEGVTNIRGKIVPIINLKKRLNLEGPSIEKNTRIIVLDIMDEMIGFEVDRVLEVIRTDLEKIMEFNEDGKKVPKDFFNGIIKTDTGIITLLDLQKLI